MADVKEQGGERPAEPRGFGEHARGLAGEYAHEQGWGLNEPERTAVPEGRQPADGGKDYDYGARDFGDEPADTSSAPEGLEKKVEEALGGTTQGGDVRKSSTTPNHDEGKVDSAK